MTEAIGLEHPHRQAADWLDSVAVPAPDGSGPLLPLMSLATVDADGAPAVRSVLLSAVTEDGFAFHTDGRSAKVTDLDGEPRMALVVVAADRTSQLVVQGTAARQPEVQARLAWDHRPPYLRRLAWLNDPEFARLPDAERVRRWAEVTAAEPDGPTEPPSSWVGYAITPSRYVFWRASTETASRRTEYTRVPDGWRRAYLPG